jgi:GNAT superfamily N-acetyltransferase
VAETPGQLHEVLAKGMRIYRRDPHAVPPHFPSLRRALAQDEALLAVQIDALPKEPMERGVGLEVPVASAVVRRVGEEAFLTLLRVVNDEASLERLLATLSEELAPLGVRSLVGPCEASPYLGAGTLTSHWREPPFMTPYNPPYLPELLLPQAEGAKATLYVLPAEREASTEGPATVAPLELPLARELLPALQAACESLPLPPPDEREARFIEALLAPYPVAGAVARLKGEVLGLALWCPDLSQALRRSSGARGLLGRLTFAFFKGRPARQGRLFFLGVVPDARGQGIGRQLLGYALQNARAQGWQALTVGPVADGTPGARWLQRQQAEALRRYTLFRFAL